MRPHFSALLAAALAVPIITTGAAAQTTIGGPVGNGTNANQQTGVNAAISTGQIGSTSSAAGGAGGMVTNNIGGFGSPDGRNVLRYEGRYTVRNNPDLAALTAATANACALPSGATGSMFGVGLGAMVTSESARCNARADAAMLVALGRPDAALQLLAQNEQVRNAIEAAQVAQRNAAAQVAAAPPLVRSYCISAARESAADRLMRERNCAAR